MPFALQRQLGVLYLWSICLPRAVWSFQIFSSFCFKIWHKQTASKSLQKTAQKTPQKCWNRRNCRNTCTLFLRSGKNSNYGIELPGSLSSFLASFSLSAGFSSCMTNKYFPQSQSLAPLVRHFNVGGGLRNCEFRFDKLTICLVGTSENKLCWIANDSTVKVCRGDFLLFFLFGGTPNEQKDISFRASLTLAGGAGSGSFLAVPESAGTWGPLKSPINLENMSRSLKAHLLSHWFLAKDHWRNISRAKWSLLWPHPPFLLGPPSLVHLLRSGVSSYSGWPRAY